ncbi:hypothetical protein D7Y13_21825 [Corallococcus praedator]|uniref:Bacterial surface antigen (D15) domain-containing protein n=1 Tax=Corallococcus praedator TaxID=2316724 RepID=A0ABX9QEG2_9BACT|nr:MULTISPECIES: hypothetical protein [Corallococcus]RKH26108.1 hypothetical protein D7X75_28855 [Corallococcus sp. CA031C]RKI05756.1 hypothetical protein D7Y13_21825 [Corallococcus praedator]
MSASSGSARQPALLACLLLLTSGCAFVAPRFPQNVQASFARDDMHKLTTRSLELYYPAHLRPTALRVAARMEGCVDRLRADAWSKAERKRVLVYLTSADFNNAYVQSEFASTPQQMVLPQHMTLEQFNLLGLGETDIGDVACHESVHYVQMQQVGGLWNLLNTLSGGLFQPNIFTESWFLEGLATYYEGRLGKETGRPYSPVWRGWWEGAVQARRGELNAGYLSPENRALEPFGGNYLSGMHFVEYLARTYGEKRLWKLVEEQGNSIVPPIAVTLRFKRVYGKDIGSLFSEYEQSLQKNLQVRERPATQQVVVQDAGYFSRLAANPRDGSTALLSVGREQITHLTVRERDGRERFSRALVQLLPGRRWVLASPSLASGMTFSRDGAWLYMVGADVDAVGSYTAKLWRVDARTGDVVRLWDGLEGMGGDISEDGKSYVFVQVRGDAANLVRLDLESGRQERLTDFQAHTALGPPATSPEGQRQVFPMSGKEGWDLVLREPDGSLRWLTRDGLFNYSPRWLDADHLAFLREHEGRLQVHVMTVSTRRIARVTDAPHLTMDVAPEGEDSVVFINRDGTNLTVDRAPLTQALAELRTASTPVAEANTAPGDANAASPSTVSPTPSGLAGAPNAPPPPSGTPTSEASEGFADFPGQGTEGALPTSPEAVAQVPAETSVAPPLTSDPDSDLDGPVVPPAVVGRDVDVLSDQPYSTLEGFLVPNYRLPYFYTVPNDIDGEDPYLAVGLALAGQDRLGFHAYSLLLTYDTKVEQPGVTFAYGNAQLSPIYLQVSASRIRETNRTDLQATAFASRTFWTTPVQFGVLALDRRFDATDRRPQLITRLIGPEVAASYFAGEGTSYGGTQRGLGLSLSGAVYPKAFARDSTVGDVRLGVEGFTGGLPFTGKDNFQLSAVGRYLPGAPDGLLEVGGILPGQAFFTSRDSTDEGSLPLQLQPGLAFTEYLRGYEDHTFSARNVLIGTARYRYRVIVDYGWASTLWVLPSLFVSQFELEGFGTLARTDNRNNHGAVGGSATLRLSVGQAYAISFFYQYARRFNDGLGDLHLIGATF